MPLLALSTLGPDRPGVVAAVSAVLLEAGCNIEESAMTRLRGEFAMMLIVETSHPPEHLRAQLADVAAELELLVSVRTATADSPETDEVRCTVSVHGADHPGIVHAVTSLLAGRGVNVVDLVTHVLHSTAGAVYVMVLEVIVPSGIDPAELGIALEALAADQGVRATISVVDAQTL